MPISWDDKTGRGILWKTPVPLPGNNSPIVWEDKVFLSGATSERREVYCFDTNSGKLLWQRDVPSQADGKLELLPETGYAAPSMTTDGRFVFAIFANGALAAFDMSGNLKWNRDLGIPENPYGHASSLAMYRDLLLVQYDQGTKRDDKSRLLAVSAATGKIRWAVAREVGASWMTPIVIRHDGRDQVITGSDPWVIAYDPAKGKELWRSASLSGDCGPSPVFAGGAVHVGNEFCAWSAIAVDGDGDVTRSKVLWTAEEALPDTVSPLATEDFLLLIDSTSTLTCYNSKTGKRLWEDDETFRAARFTSSPGMAGDCVFLFGNIEEEDASGTPVTWCKTWVLQLNRDGHWIAGEANLQEGCVTSPAFQDGRIYIRGAAHLYCLAGASKDSATPAARTVFLPDAATPGAAVVLDLASGVMLPISGDRGFFEARDFTRRHHKGDLYYGYDEEDGGGFIGCMRGASPMIWDGERTRPFRRSRKRGEVTVCLLPPLPCRLRITTAEQKAFDVTILRADKSTEDDRGVPTGVSGIRLKYQPIEPVAGTSSAPRQAFPEQLAITTGDVGVSTARVAPSDETSTASILARMGAKLGFDDEFHVVSVNLQLTSFGDADVEHLHLENLPHLKQLLLFGTKITDAGLARIGKLKQLEKLDLSRTSVGDEGVARLTGLTKLKWLSVYGTRITDKGVKHLETLSALEHLFLGETSISDAGLASVAALENLKELYLHDTQITDAGLARLAGLSHLESLSLKSTEVTDFALIPLANLKNLRSLSCRGTRISEAGLQKLCEAIPGLRVDQPEVPIPAKTREEIERILARRSTSVDFDDIRLDDMLQRIAHMVDVEIVLDGRTLLEAGVDPDTPIKLKLAKTSPAKTLEAALKPLGLTFEIRDGAIVVRAVLVDGAGQDIEELEVRTVFLPDVETPDVGVVLDLATGELLPIADASEFARLGKGDLFYDDAHGGSLGFVRGAQTANWNGPPRDPASERTHRLSPLPCQVEIWTAEGKSFDVTILQTDKSRESDEGIPRDVTGIRLRYELLDRTSLWGPRFDPLQEAQPTNVSESLPVQEDSAMPALDEVLPLAVGSDGAGEEYHWPIESNAGARLAHGWVAFDKKDGEIAIREHRGGSSSLSPAEQPRELILRKSVKEGVLSLQMTTRWQAKSASLVAKLDFPKETLLRVGKPPTVTGWTNEYQVLWRGDFVKGLTIVKSVAYVARLSPLAEQYDGFAKQELSKVIAALRKSEGSYESPDAPAPHPETHGDSATIFLPDVETPGVGVVLDLGSGRVLPPIADRSQGLREYANLDRGDLFYDDAKGGVLGCLRGAKIKFSLERMVHLAPQQGPAGTTIYKLPSLPWQLEIVTAERKRATLTILTAGKSEAGDAGLPRGIPGIRLTYTLRIGQDITVAY